jgi:serine-type D-Ala-D-Ala carboxypeptidase/endopeptidase (penicillin-binding protein 4)
VALADQIAAILAPTAVTRDHWGIQVTALDGTVLYSLNEGQLFQPASDTKLFTTAAVMALLPLAHRFTSSVTGSGLFLEDGTLRGNLFLNGSGDANFCAHDLPYPAPPARSGGAADRPLGDLEEMADQVKASGVKRVEGDVIATDPFAWQPYPADWSEDDLVWGYAAPVSGLSVADNTLKLTVSSTQAGTAANDPARTNDPRLSNPMPMKDAFPAVASIDEAFPYYTVETYALSAINQPATSIQISRAPESHVVRVDGTIAPGAPPVVEQIAIDDPAAYAAMAFRQMLMDRGIAVTGLAVTPHSASAPMPAITGDFAKESIEPIADLSPLPAGRNFLQSSPGGCAHCDRRLSVRTLATHVSPPLLEDVVVTNKESLNLHAELLLLQLGLAVTGRGERAEGARVVRQFLINAGIDGKDFVFFDGSGLSGHDLVTPRATAKLLQYAATQPWFAPWKASLPVGGMDGTLARRFADTPLKGHIFAKTGTLGEARALSGYLDAASGRTVIFSIFVGNHLPNTADDRDAMDRIVAAIQASE